MALVSTPTDLYKGALERFDDVHIPANPNKRQKRALADSAEEATRFVGLDLIDDESEDEGEIMLLAMILLQIHGVKLSNAGSLLSSSSSSIIDQDNENKKKRQRTSPEQLAILEQIFQTDKMPSQQTRIHLADQLGMSSRRVQIWFQNKRAKVKRGLNKSNEFEEPSSPIDDDEVPSPKGFLSSPSSSSSVSEQQQAILASFASSCDNITTSTSSSLSALSKLNLLASSTSFVPSLSPLKKSQILSKETPC